jgi:hypothetical protein
MNEDDDSIEVHYNERSQHLELACGPAAFRRILDFLRKESSLDEIVDVPSDSLKWIGITNANAVVERRERARLRDRFALLGCGLVGFVVLFVFVMGVLAIVGLVALPR